MSTFLDGYVAFTNGFVYAFTLTTLFIYWRTLRK